MTETTGWHVDGVRGRVAVREWRGEQATHRVVLSHGYGEHSGRYAHVAERLVQGGAVVVAPDHLGHGRSEGERALVHDFTEVVDDLHTVIEHAGATGPALPLAVVGHSMGSTVAALHAQRHAPEVGALVLSAAVVGPWPPATALLSMPEFPDVPIDPAALSRDPRVGEAYLSDELVYQGPFKRPTLEALVAAFAQIGSGPRLSMPTLWLHGERDPLMELGDARPAVERIRGPHLEECIYPGALHEVFNETNADEVLADLTGFLGRVLQPESAVTPT